MRERTNVPLAELTTLRLGGPARRLIEASTEDELVEAVSEAGEPVLVIAGGSNLVISDDGFDGTVVHVATRGISIEGTRLTVAAGELWDEIVARTVAEGLAGIECLSGIPGSAGATPIQNVGAYGEEVAQTIASVRVYDRKTGEVRDLAPHQCGFGYRTSAFKHSDRHLVLSVTYALERSALGRPVRYAELAHALGLELGEQAPLTAVREAVMAVRRGKGMVIDPDDPESVSAGSFFTNPVLSEAEFEELRRRAGIEPPGWPEGEGAVKTSAAWLIQQAGFHRGYGNGRVGVSRKHTLALVNRGGAHTGDLVALARELRDGVRETFGVTLAPEPTLVGVEL